jgi:hypothetical protein
LKSHKIEAECDLKNEATSCNLLAAKLLVFRVSVDAYLNTISIKNLYFNSIFRLQRSDFSVCHSLPEFIKNFFAALYGGSQMSEEDRETLKEWLDNQ